MFQKTIFAAALTAIGFMLSASAAAQVYVGAAAGQATWDVDCTGTSSCSSTDTAFKVFGGYTFAPQWAVEVSYFSLGTISATVGSINSEMKATGFDVAGVYKANLNKNWGLFAKLGLAAVKGETTATSGSFSGSLSTNSTQPVVGFGVAYSVNKDVAIRADIDSRRVKLASGDGGSGNVTNWSIGAQFPF